jgi:hypothetical protein
MGLRFHSGNSTILEILIRIETFLQNKINEVIMPQLLVDISIHKVAEIIRTMNTPELETLYLLLTDEGKELLNRKQDLESNRVKFLNREEVFDVS